MLSASNTVYIGKPCMYTNVGEMCFIPMNVHNELFDCVRQMAARFACSFNIFYL